MQSYSLQDLQQKANQIRQSVIKMLLNAESGHSAGSLGMADVFTALYAVVMNHDPKKPDWQDRDRLILSNGHICPVLYASLAEFSYFDKKELATLRDIDSKLQGHPHYRSIAGVENTSGPLGQGISQAVGLATAFQIDDSRQRVFCISSDGEHQEGQTWEAYMFAGYRKLQNLTVLIDRNNIQIEGKTEDVLSLEPLADKIEAFNWHVIEIDGHNIEAIVDACEQAKAMQTRPTAIICHTIPGKGVEFMEDDYLWHGKPPNKDQAKEALHELRTLRGRVLYE